MRAWHLRVYQTREQLAQSAGLPVSTVTRLLGSGREKLLNARQKRVWPGLDDKILTSWNGLMIRGLAIGARVLAREDLADAAAHATDFARQSLMVNHRLLATYKEGRARFNGYLDDYAFLLDAVIELLQTRWNTEHLCFAMELADGLLEHFEDRENGGFWFTSHDHEVLLARTKPLADEAMPSGNGVAAFALARLGYLLAEPRYLDGAARTLEIGWRALAEFPQRHCSLLNALEEWLDPRNSSFFGEFGGHRSLGDQAQSGLPSPATGVQLASGLGGAAPCLGKQAPTYLQGGCPSVPVPGNRLFIALGLVGGTGSPLERIT